MLSIVKYEVEHLKTYNLTICCSVMAQDNSQIILVLYKLEQMEGRSTKMIIEILMNWLDILCIYQKNIPFKFRNYFLTEAWMLHCETCFLNYMGRGDIVESQSPNYLTSGFATNLL